MNRHIVRNNFHLGCTIYCFSIDIAMCVCAIVTSQNLQCHAVIFACAYNVQLGGNSSQLGMGAVICRKVRNPASHQLMDSIKASWDFQWTAYITGWNMEKLDKLSHKTFNVRFIILDLSYKFSKKTLQFKAGLKGSDRDKISLQLLLERHNG